MDDYQIQESLQLGGKNVSIFEKHVAHHHLEIQDVDKTVHLIHE